MDYQKTFLFASFTVFFISGILTQIFSSIFLLYTMIVFGFISLFLFRMQWLKWQKKNIASIEQGKSPIFGKDIPVEKRKSYKFWYITFLAILVIAGASENLSKNNLLKSFFNNKSPVQQENIQEDKVAARALTINELKNANYSGVQLVNGEAQWNDVGTNGQPSGIKGITKLDESNVIFGDLNGDGILDAVVVLLSGFAGLESHSSVYVVINNNGQPKVLNFTDGWDRVRNISGISSFEERIKSLSIDNGILTVNVTLLYYEGQQHYLGGQYSKYTGQKIDYKYASNVYESNIIALKYKVSGDVILPVDN
jgi:hypothetical protein